MNRILETVAGYEAAKREIAGCMQRWNEINGLDDDGEIRMRISRPSGLRADDHAGSGEFYEAVCVNNEATSAADEIYEITTGW